MTQTIAQSAEVIAPVQTPDTLVVTVLPRHIAAGEQACADRCPVALALLDSGWADVSVGLDGLAVYATNWLVVHFDFPADSELGDWIRRFDAGMPVEPERFVLHAIR